MTIRVVIADDSLLVREGILHVLAHAREIEIVAVATDEDSLLAAVDDHHPDVVLTDIRMPPTQGMEGIRIARRLRETHPAVGVIVLSQYADPQYALALLEQGSARRGYLLKDALGERGELAAAIVEVAAGGAVIDPQVVEELVLSRRADETSPLNSLTPREHQVLAEIATGKSNAAIARSLVVSKRAVERHVGSIFAKLNLPADDEASRRVSATLVFLAGRRGP